MALLELEQESGLTRGATSRPQLRADLLTEAREIQSELLPATQMVFWHAQQVLVAPVTDLLVESEMYLCLARDFGLIKKPR